MHDDVADRLAYDLEPGGPALVLISGLPGSGKSTFARRLARATGAIHVETDRVRRGIFTVRTYSGEENQAVYEASQAAIGVLLAARRQIIFDATNLATNSRQAACDLARKTGSGLAFVQFDPPESVIRARLTRRAVARDPEDVSEATEYVYDLLKPGFRLMTGPHWRITSDDEAERALATLATLLTGR